MFSNSNPNPAPPQNFRGLHRQEQAESNMDMDIDDSIPSLPPNVYIVPNVPADKPAPNWLRMVCISDTHNTTDFNNYSIPEADILVHAGDFTKVGTTAQIEQFISWMKSLNHIPLKIIVAGNHEVILDKEFYERKWNRFHTTKEDHEAAVSKLKSAGHGIIYLDNESYNVDGAKILYKKWQKREKESFKNKTLQQIHAEGAAAAIAGIAAVDPREGWSQGYKIWASPWQPEFYDWAFNEVRGKLHEIWKHIPEDTDILVTHGPPKYHGDVVPENNYINAGCWELLQRLKVVKPLYHIFGHIHQGYGVSQIDWSSQAAVIPPTVCINASTCTVKYRPLNQPIIVDLPPK
ncbi:metallophosphoesterase domain-containing protein 1 [Entomortierella lignicola]|nr:metallophosphoesterase domain-containing protein 1 [Entomortierella lignicola]